MRINVNDTVFVKLNDRGRQLWSEWFKKMELEEHAPPPQDEQGRTRFHLWELMQKFGWRMGNGIPIPFETTEIEIETAPVPMILFCPLCRSRHLDAPPYDTRPHHTHACQRCGHCWRPAVVPTVGVQFLPGFKDPQPHS